MRVRANEIWLLLDAERDSDLGLRVVWLALGLRDLGVNTRILVLGSGWLARAALAVAVANARGIPTRRLSGGLMGLIAALLGERPALLHTHGPKAGPLGRLAGLMTGVPVVSTIASQALNGPQGCLYAALDHLSRAWGQSVVTGSALTGPRPIAPFVPLGQRPQTLAKTTAYVASPGHDKTVDRFLRLARLLPPIALDLYLDAQGPVPAPAALGQVRLRRTPPDNSVPWQDVGLLCVLSSSDAALGRALDAMAHGVPVVAYDTGLLSQVVDDGVNGWLVRCDNLPGVTRLINRWEGMDESGRRALSDAARRSIAEGFSTQTAMAQLLAAYGLSGQ